MKTNITSTITMLRGMSEDGINKYFDSNCNLTFADFGELISQLVEMPSAFNIFTACLRSNKFKEMPLACDKWGNSIIHMMLYTIVGYLSTDKDTVDPSMVNLGKITKKQFMDLLLSDDIKFPWDSLNNAYETPLHIVFSYLDIFSYEDAVKLTQKSIFNGLHTTNRDIDSNNISMLINQSNILTITEKQYLLNLINSVADTEVLTIDRTIYQ